MLLAPILIVLVSGCINISPEDIAKASPIVKQFLAEHPNAQISVTHFTQSQAEGMLDVIKQDCDNPYIEAKEFYRITVDDNETGFKAVAWIDWENQIVECAYKEGYLGKREYGDKEVDPNKCVSKHVRKCYEGNSYWYDSCGNRQDKAERCSYGCAEGQCVESECKSHAQSKCYGSHVYWFDSCGHVQDKKEYCDYGCENGFCNNKTTEKCYDSDGGKNYHVKGVAETSTQRLEDHCNDDGTLTEKYCSDSGEIKAEVVECPNGCLEGACIPGNETDLCEGVTCPDDCYNSSDRRHGGECVEGQCIYEYETCPNGCLEGACVEEDTTPPQITLISPENGSSATESPTTVTVITDEEATCQSKYVVYSGGSAGETVWTAMESVDGLTHNESQDVGDESIYTFTVKCEDSSENSNEIVFEFDVDLGIAPTLTITHPENNSNVTLNPVGIIVQTSQIATCEHQAGIYFPPPECNESEGPCGGGSGGGTYWGPMDETGGIWHSTTYNLTDGGEYTVNVRCTDAHGHVSETEYVRFTATL